MKILEPIDSMDETVKKRKEFEYQQSPFQTTSATSAGVRFMDNYRINGTPFNIVGANGSYIINGEH